jgi:hypothetical protein
MNLISLARSGCIGKREAKMETSLSEFSLPSVVEISPHTYIP